MNIYNRIINILLESKLTKYIGEKPARKVGPLDTPDNKLGSMAVRSAQAKRLVRFRDGLGGKFRRDIYTAKAKVRGQENPTPPISKDEKATKRGKKR